MDRTSGILKSWSLGLEPDRVGRSSGSSSTLEAVVFLALSKSHTKTAMTKRRMIDSAAKQPMTILSRVRRSAKGTKKSTLKLKD